MSKFKDMVKRDIHKVFLNTSEFAEKRTVRYDGEEYPDIPVVLEGPVREKRDRLTDDHVRGLHMMTAVLYCAQEDMGGKVPKQGGQPGDRHPRGREVLSEILRGGVHQPHGDAAR